MWIGSTRCVIRTILAGLCTIFLGANIAIAQSENWSFVDHPHPTGEELSVNNKLVLDQEDLPILDDESCEKDVEEAYQKYLERYPAFEEFSDIETKFLSWKHHIVEFGGSELDICIFSGAWARLLHLYVKTPGSEFYYCGQFSHPPASDEEHETASQIDVLVDFARTGFGLSVEDLMMANELMDSVELNPDVEYFFRKNIEPRYYFDQEHRDVSHLLPLLSDDRLAFLDNAVARHDLQAVLATTDPCPPRQSFSN